MREAEREALATRVLSFAGGLACEVIVGDTSTGLTRFTRNAVHQNVASADTTVRVRAVVDGRTGVATVNDRSDASLRATVERASALAAFAPRDRDAAPLRAHARVASPPAAFDAATAQATPERRAAIAGEIIAEAERASMWAAGYVQTSTAGITIANSCGTLVSFDGTDCGLNVKQNGADSTGFAERYGTAAGVLDGTAAGALAAEKVRAGAAPAAVEPGAWTVILEPPAIGELLSYITEHFSARAVDEGSSFLGDGLGRPYAGPNVWIADDFAHPLLAGMPFDYEGNPRTRVPLFEAGVAHNVVTDARWAARLDRPNTGHGLPAPSAAGPEPLHVVVAGGEKPLARLIAETARGLLVSRFWYIRPVDRRRTIVTGMTRDGTFLIENGAIVRGVRNLRFNHSILDALRHCEFASEQARTGGYGYAMVTPAVKIEGFRFTSGTDF